MDTKEAVQQQCESVSRIGWDDMWDICECHIYSLSISKFSIQFSTKLNNDVWSEIQIIKEQASYGYSPSILADFYENNRFCSFIW